jgi:hypothetical protein
MISDYCRKRVAAVLSPRETEAICQYLLKALRRDVLLPSATSKLWSNISVETGISIAHLSDAKSQLVPILDALTRSLARRSHLDRLKQGIVAGKAARSEAIVVRHKEHAPTVKSRCLTKSSHLVCTQSASKEADPAPLWTQWDDPETFAEALRLHIDRHGETRTKLHRTMMRVGYSLDLRSFIRWSTGELVPRSVQSMDILKWIERRYRLKSNYFKAKLPHQARAVQGHALGGMSASERRRLSWHLPDDFNSKTGEKQEEILAWVNRVIISGSTNYREFHATAIKTKYSVRFTALPFRRKLTTGAAKEARLETSNEAASVVIDAPSVLDREMDKLLRFKTSTLTELGFQRSGVWNEETASQKVEHLGLLFGALAASPKAAVRGFGVNPDCLCFAMLVFPETWDWYIQWRERRRGFYTHWEVDMLGVALAMVRKETGWLRQNRSLANRLKPIAGLISENDIAAAQNDWDSACDLMSKHGKSRIKEISRVVRVHRDPFEPILPILESENPVGEYRKITEEIVRLIPDEQRYPRSAAEMIRSFLMLRLGLHLGLRQRNLRELRVCLRGQTSTTERQLQDMRCGELRWSERDCGWEVFIPSIAFKNASSSFFGAKPFKLILPNLGGLYEKIDAYLDRHRARLLGPASDPGTFFVKTAKKSSSNAAYDQHTFYEAWRLIIQRHGIYNPHTGRGAITGLLPHGPHNVRDVLATHILKKTGSYEQASYAIQDTPDTVAKHYGRFLPQDKSAIAAQILNRAWEAS